MFLPCLRYTNVQCPSGSPCGRWPRTATPCSASSPPRRSCSSSPRWSAGLAPLIGGLDDKADRPRVHRGAIPRIGGLAIVTGILVPTAMLDRPRRALPGHLHRHAAGRRARPARRHPRRLAEREAGRRQRDRADPGRRLRRDVRARDAPGLGDLDLGWRRLSADDPLDRPARQPGEPDRRDGLAGRGDRRHRGRRRSRSSRRRSGARTPRSCRPSCAARRSASCSTTTTRRRSSWATPGRWRWASCSPRCRSTACSRPRRRSRSSRRCWCSPCRSSTRRSWCSSGSSTAARRGAPTTTTSTTGSCASASPSAAPPPTCTCGR